MRMRQSLAELESAFHEETDEARERRERIVRNAAVRTHRRELDRVHRRGSLRFVVLVLVLLGTAALVTVLMFQALYWVLG